ncbi:hypothetical protein [Azomonas macrocytogenes]|uniref:Uncharacterized protein n=1 Tax=Azomonas macrocytogenes TaxID=69962 RepID=A0A839T7Z4_AZOMA|nr:hypothetical protein [Azomonas macrocytogenes]MBB3105208.1 hypothetical protein [Azomonas macrocytogenes]
MNSRMFRLDFLPLLLLALAGRVQILELQLGQRVRKLLASHNIAFLYTPDGQLLGETTFDNQGRKLGSQYYLWLDETPIGGVTVAYNASGAVTFSTPFYIHSDHLNTPRLITGNTRQTLWSWDSDGFGNGQPSGAFAFNLRLPG